MVLTGLAGLLIMLGILIFLAVDQRIEIRRSAERDVKAATYLLADHAKRLFETADVALQTAMVESEDMSWDSISASRDLHLRLKALEVALPYIDDVWLNDPKGVLRLTSFAFPSPFSDASDRDAFKAQLQPNNGMSIGERIVGRVTGKPTFLLARRLSERDGGFRGMVSVTADLAYFDDYWKSVKLPYDARVTLMRAEQLDVLAQFPAPEPKLGFVKPNVAAFRAALADAPTEGTFEFRSTRGGEVRTAAYERVGDLPVFLTVTVSEAAIARAWRDRVFAYAPFALAATLAFGALSFLGFRQAQRDAATRAETADRAAELTEANERLRAEASQRQQAEEQLRQSQKMEAVGQLTGGLAHDFNNLLVGISGSLELMRTRIRQERPDEVERFIAVAQDSAKRAAALTHRLLAFSRRQTLDPKPTDVDRLVTGMAEIVRRTVGPEIRVEFHGTPALWPTLVDPNQLENALLNLCINARDAMPHGGRITVQTANQRIDERTAAERDMRPGDYVALVVSDTGAGMSPDILDRVFEPFFTTKPIGLGTGLGLSMIYGFARQSGGQVRIQSLIGQGTTVTILLPQHATPAVEPDLVANEPDDSVATGGTVLVIDDEPMVRTLVVDALGDLGYRTIEAADGREGLEILRSATRLDLLLTDVGLPNGMNGRQVADAARELRPDLKILFATGYAESVVLNHGHLVHGMGIITKPFGMAELGRRVRSLIADA